MCNERKTSESSIASSGSVSSCHDTKIPTTIVGAKRGRRLQIPKEAGETNIVNVEHQNGSSHSLPDSKKPISGTVRSLRSRTVRSVGSDITQTTESDSSQSISKDGKRSGMRLRNKKTLESAPPSTTPAMNCPSAQTETEDTGVAGDVYDFTDSENESGLQRESPPASDKDIAAEERKVRPITPPPREIAAHQPTLMPSPGGRLKLTLRMKRSPVLDEVIESGSSMGGGSLHQQNVIPVYEVLRVEGLEMEPEHEQVHKNRVRRTQRRRSPSTSTDSSRMGVLPTTKRLRLIFGNESHTIDLPPTNLSNFSAIE